MYKMADLFSGSRSVGKVFERRGWKVYYVDIIDGLDVRLWHPPENLDFVWASPPCERYSDVPWKKWNLHPNEYDFELWGHVLRIVREGNAKYYIIENVRGAQRYHGKAVSHAGSRYFWGDFPRFYIPDGPDLYGKYKLPPSKDRPMLRSMIPERITVSIIDILEKKLNENHH